MGTPLRLAALVLSVVAAAVVLVYVLRVTPGDLTWLLVVLTLSSWASFVVLGHAALEPPRIGALSERAFIAFIIAVLGSVSCVIVANTDAGQPWFDTQVASLLFRLTILAVLAVPTVWLILWYSGRLGQGGHG
jgi:hypothetical protein